MQLKIKKHLKWINLIPTSQQMILKIQLFSINIKFKIINKIYEKKRESK